MNHPLAPDYAVSPGSVLADTLDDLGMTPPALAAAALLTQSYVNELLAGEAVLGELAAEGLEAATGVSAGFWLSVEANYRQDIAAGRRRAKS